MNDYNLNDEWDQYMLRHGPEGGYASDTVYELEGKGYPICDFNCCLEKPGSDAPRCLTVNQDPRDPPEEQCRGVATHTMFYSLRDWETQIREYFHEPACLPCVRSFRRRPAPHVEAYRIGEEPTPLLVPGNGPLFQTDQSDSKKESAA